ncbi:hypothetical protein BDZ45DRAFT_339412 [Acephala macrosclerotiorum]|nr:hypothetical protein BDZ45DRAFT_339412 [Acephala macrosclerotiorum]
MFGFGDAQDSYQQVQDSGNTSSLSHEVVAGGASFAAFKYFEDQQRKEGKPVSHAFAKELLAGFAGAEVDKLAETKGEDAWDTFEAKRKAKQNVEELYDQHYGGQDQYNPDYPAHDSMGYN